MMIALSMTSAVPSLNVMLTYVARALVSEAKPLIHR
jgi:hypothetical protein